MPRSGSSPFGAALLCAALLASAPASAQSKPQTPPAPQPSADGSAGQDGASSAVQDPDARSKDDRDADRLFGAPASYTIVERKKLFRALTAKQTLRIATLESFGPHEFLFVGAQAGLAQLQNQEPSWGNGMSGYGKRYLTTFSENTIGTMMTLGVLPAVLHQDPRYFELGEGSRWRRAAYAASRIVVTRGHNGGRQFNVSEIGGDAIAVGVSNAYYPTEEQSFADVMARFGTQLLWHTVSNEVKEFWPDIRRKMKRTR